MSFEIPHTSRSNEPILARRLGMSTHVSPLRMKLTRLAGEHPAKDAECIEDWLLDVANTRGARIFVRRISPDPGFSPPPADVLPDEELVVGICLLQSRDRPQLLRVAAQIISRETPDFQRLAAAARRERVEIVLAEMAGQALKVSPDHSLWMRIAGLFRDVPRPRSPIIHWTRMAEPVPDERGCNASGWKLVT